MHGATSNVLVPNGKDGLEDVDKWTVQGPTITSFMIKMEALQEKSVRFLPITHG